MKPPFEASLELERASGWFVLVLEIGLDGGDVELGHRRKIDVAIIGSDDLSRQVCLVHIERVAAQ